MNVLVEYVTFVGTFLHLISSVIFMYLFIRTLRTKDGIGLLFLRFLTLGMSLSSFVIFAVRWLSDNGRISVQDARAIAVVSPAMLVALALYLNYLFHKEPEKLPPLLAKDVKEIKKDVKEVKADVKEVKNKVI